MTNGLYKTIADQVASIVRKRPSLPLQLIDLKGIIRDLGFAGRMRQGPDDIAVLNVTLTPSEVLDVVLTNKKVRHLIHSTGKDFENELASIIVMNFELKSVFSDPLTMLFGLNCSGSSLCYKFNSGSQKSDLLKVVEEYVKNVPHGPRRLGDILFACDEFFTNGIVHSEGKSNTDRKKLSELKLSGEKESLIFLDTQDDHLVIGCVDPGGRLDINKVLTHIRQCYALGPSNSICAIGGAGIGLWKVFSTSEAFYLGIIPGQASLVITKIRLARKKEKNGPELHLIEEES